MTTIRASSIYFTILIISLHHSVSFCLWDSEFVCMAGMGWFWRWIHVESDGERGWAENRGIAKPLNETWRKHYWDEFTLLHWRLAARLLLNLFLFYASSLNLLPSCQSGLPWRQAGDYLSVVGCGMALPEYVESRAWEWSWVEWPDRDVCLMWARSCAWNKTMWWHGCDGSAWLCIICIAVILPLWWYCSWFCIICIVILAILLS